MAVPDLHRSTKAAIWLSTAATVISAIVTELATGNLLASIGVAGSAASVGSLVVLYLQVRNLTSLSAAVSQAVGEFRDRTESMRSVADTAHLSGLVASVRQHLRTPNWDAARIQLASTHDGFVRLLSHPASRPYLSVERCEQIASNLGIEMTLLEQVAGDGGSYDPKQLNTTLTDMVTVMTELETRLLASGGSNAAD